MERMTIFISETGFNSLENELLDHIDEAVSKVLPIKRLSRKARLKLELAIDRFVDEIKEVHAMEVPFG